jgi:DNA polymerase elongation subunit (family B)
MSPVSAWLFDLYPAPHGITLWLVDGEGRKHRCTRPFVPSFFLHLDDAGTARAREAVRTFPFPVTFERTEQKEIYSNAVWSVVRVGVHNPTGFTAVVRRLERHFPHFVFFNSDIAVPQLFLYDTGLFPLARGTYELDAAGQLTGWQLNDDREALEYTMPPLVTMILKQQEDFVSPKYRRTCRMEVRYDNTAYLLEQEEPADVLHALNRHLERCDPDIIMTEYGDAVLLPMLARLGIQENVPLLLNRDAAAGYFTTNATSYFAYGKVVHKDGAFELAGRWHIDIGNSFMMGEASLDGVTEIARMTQLPVQHQSRSTIGSALSSMQLSWAHRNGYLIPARKREPEEFKTAGTLLLADRGGLIFQPDMGYHEQVAELDFVSMYPTIMVEHNVSPETVNCRCCSNHAVPELQYTICEKREGIVPATLRGIVRRRAFYKHEKKRLKRLGDPRWELYDHRQNALKWMLVTCFGYLGYKNARFGRIEAHESVNAFSRDAILTAKEIAERQGYRFLHAIIDCLWLKKEGATEQDYERLAAEISASAGIELSLEGIYRWILFPASKMDPQIPTANRYVGYYVNGEIKVRGIEVRRHDTPVFIKRLQGEMLKVFAPAHNVHDVGTLVPAALATAKTFIDLLRSGAADPRELVIRRHLSREADEYTNRSANAVVAKTLKEAGIALAPGEMVEYVLVDATGKKNPQKAVPIALYALDDGYDIAKYTDMALDAVETLVHPWGWSGEKLREWFLGPAVRKTRRNAMQVREETAQLSLFRPQTPIDN